MIAVSYMVSIIYNFCIINKGETVAFPHRSCSQEFGSETVKNGHVTRALHQVVVYLMEKKSHICDFACSSVSLMECYWNGGIRMQLRSDPEENTEHQAM